MDVSQLKRQKKNTINFQVDQTVRDKLQALAKHFDNTQSKILTKLVELAYDEMLREEAEK